MHPFIKCHIFDSPKYINNSQTGKNILQTSVFLYPSAMYFLVFRDETHSLNQQVKGTQSTE